MDNSGGLSMELILVSRLLGLPSATCSPNSSGWNRRICSIRSHLAPGFFVCCQRRVLFPAKVAFFFPSWTVSSWSLVKWNCCHTSSYRWKWIGLKQIRVATGILYQSLLQCRVKLESTNIYSNSRSTEHAMGGHDIINDHIRSTGVGDLFTHVCDFVYWIVEGASRTTPAPQATQVGARPAPQVCCIQKKKKKKPTM